MENPTNHRRSNFTNTPTGSPTNPIPLSSCHTSSRARTPARAFNRVTFHRAHHSATGRFTTISPQGTPVTRHVEVWLGDPGDAYVMFDPEISRAFQAGTTLRGGSLAQDQELSPLNFYHDTRHFSHIDWFGGL
ncbi:hypothetical protein LARI1_G009024 [Lachnellula arida]|uniref:Uncharacterized protein n=1 Tax=Lachnellula arida TaxID=1316785 RepID=A0A8T9B232_9HELO|nr:hypothetical protein LARI1_G009024 [Lachnellula arida]